MSVAKDGNKIIIPIEIALEDKQEWREMIQELENDKQKIPKEHQPIPDKPLTEKECECKESIDEDSSKNNKTSDPNEIAENQFMTKRQVMSLLNTATANPSNFILSKTFFGSPEFMELLLAAGIIEQIISQLTAPGGPFDVRFKRDIPNEVFNLFTREEQQARRIGTIQVIGTAVAGFRSLNGNNVENTFREIATGGRISKIGLQDKSMGWNGN